MSGKLHLPLVDLFSGDRAAAVRSIRQACLDHGFFYLTNHGIDGELFRQVFQESRDFFSLPLDEKLKLDDPVDHLAYIPPHVEILDSSKPKGDLKESFNMGPAKDSKSFIESNQWPPEECSPLMRATMDSYYENVICSKMDA